MAPGTPVRTVADLSRTNGSTAGRAPDYRAVRMDVGPAANARPAPAVRAALMNVASQALTRAQRWVDELPEPTARTWVTGAAAGLAIALAIAVVLAVG